MRIGYKKHQISNHWKGRILPNNRFQRDKAYADKRKYEAKIQMHGQPGGYDKKQLTIGRLLENKMTQSSNNLLNKIMENPIKYVTAFVSERILFSFDMTYYGHLINKNVLNKYFKHIKTSEGIHIGCDVKNYVEFDTPDWCKIYPSIDIYFYKDTPIIFNCTDKDLVSYDSTKLTILTINTKYHIDNAKKFIIKFIRESQLEYEKYQKDIVIKMNDANNYYIQKTKKRTFDNVFITDEQKQTIIDTLYKYTHSYDWYEKNNIPNHFGILLYGEPGTGKSVIAQAIADYIHGVLYTMTSDGLYSLPAICENSGMISSKPISKNNYRVLLIEDIDCSRITTSRNEVTIDESNDTTFKPKTAVKSLASVLNVLDGISAPSNIIYIFTTNYVYNLDPALIRPGRIDLKIEVKHVCWETLCKFFDFHFGTHPEKECKIKNNITFAYLQTLVMKGFSMNEIVEDIKISR